MTHREAFEESLRANPSDQVTRAVFADWLEENGDVKDAAELRWMVLNGQTTYFPKVRRRLLQKRLKHKQYRRCPKCGDRMIVRLANVNTPEEHQLWKMCQAGWSPTVNCGYTERVG